MVALEPPPLQSQQLLDVEDGIAVGLYHYLWSKDGKGRACPDVNLPHTVGAPTGRLLGSGPDALQKRLD
jgi:hypothetical protein